MRRYRLREAGPLTRLASSDASHPLPQGMRDKAMTAPDLPAELKAALDARLHGLSRSDAAARAASISQTYRDGGGSGAIRSEADALAYALARMPATYAAVTASLNALVRDQAGLRAAKPARCRRRAGHGDMGRGRSIFLAARLSRCSMPTLRCARWRSSLRATASACATWPIGTAKPAPRWPRPTPPTSWSQAT